MIETLTSIRKKSMTKVQTRILGVKGSTTETRHRIKPLEVIILNNFTIGDEGKGAKYFDF